MQDTRRLYLVEFLRVFLILSVFLVHVGDWIDTPLKRNILEFFHTKDWKPWFAVEPFFIVGGFFLYKRIVRLLYGDEGKSEYPPPVRPDIFSFFVRLWVRLMPGIIFCYTLLVTFGARNWWDFPFLLFPASGYGITAELVGYADWFIGVYFLTNCLFMTLFFSFRKTAWFWVCTLTILCWCLTLNMQADKLVMGGTGGMYYGFLSRNMARGISCMGLGMVAAYLSGRWCPRAGVALRLTATALEVLCVVMLFNYMYRTSLVHYNFVAVQIMVALLLISAAHSLGYISVLLNRFSGIMYVSRYTYSILLIQGMLVRYFYVNHNFGMNSRDCFFIILAVAIPLVLTEYHLIEKWLVPRLLSFSKSTPRTERTSTPKCV